jgi:CubicO group peptidase (beta-lactamase class C family)
MQLVEEGKLELDRDVGGYVGFPVRHPRGGEPITLRLLLTHRGGIRDRQDEIRAGAEGNPLGPFLKAYLVAGDGPRAAAFLETRPGAAMEYSNVGAALAAFAVERVSGESFASTSVRRVFTPLRMKSTTWTKSSEASPVWATPHVYQDAGFVPVPHPFHAVYPSVDLRSSARDLARFARAVLRDGELDGARILSAASVRAMLHGEGDQALAWQLRSIGGARVAGHEGEDAGATTALFLDLAAGTGAVVLANGDAFGSGNEARASAIQSLVADLLSTARPR